MKTHPTIAGQAYVVFSKTGCTVTDSTGTLNKAVPAGDWLSIPAPSDALILDDDNAIVRNANFKLALAPSSVGGEGGSTGGGEPEGDYLLFNADRSVRGGRLDTLTNGYALLYRVAGQTEWNIPLPKLQNGENMFANSNVGGEWTWDLPELVNGRQFLYYTKVTGFTGDLPKLQDGYAFFCGVKTITSFTINMPELLQAECMFDGSSVKNVETSCPKVTSLRAFCRSCSITSIKLFAPLLTNAKEFAHFSSSLQIVDAEFPSLDTASSMFYNCQLDKPSVLKVCNSLPSWTSGSHPITLGIHVDHQGDADIATAVADIESRGWTVTLQWNGTASAASASTYRWGGRRDPVYAKLGEDSDGKPMLDWGHYITNWEGDGYMEFASIEEAREYFNIAE